MHIQTAAKVGSYLTSTSASTSTTTIADIAKDTFPMNKPFVFAKLAPSRMTSEKNDKNLRLATQKLLQQAATGIKDPAGLEYL